jgi:hypothetical protein
LFPEHQGKELVSADKKYIATIVVEVTSSTAAKYNIFGVSGKNLWKELLPRVVIAGESLGAR